MLQRHGPSPGERLRAAADPVLIGAFVGAPLLARELETGTFRYAWTQGFGRWRWTLAKLVLLAVAVIAAAGAISALFSWYYQPYFTAGNEAVFFSQPSPARRRPVRPARGRASRLDTHRLRDRRPGRHAHPPGRPRDRRHHGRLQRVGPRRRDVPPPALPGAAIHEQTERARYGIGHPPVVDKGRPGGLRGLPPINLVQQFCPPASIGAGKPVASEPSRRASPGTATRGGRAISRRAGSGPSSPSRPAGCSCFRRCSSPRPSGSSTGARPDPVSTR